MRKTVENAIRTCFVAGCVFLGSGCHGHQGPSSSNVDVDYQRQISRVKGLEDELALTEAYRDELQAEIPGVARRYHFKIDGYLLDGYRVESNNSLGQYIIFLYYKHSESEEIIPIMLMVPLSQKLGSQRSAINDLREAFEGSILFYRQSM